MSVYFDACIALQEGEGGGVRTGSWAGGAVVTVDSSRRYGMELLPMKYLAISIHIYEIATLRAALLDTLIDKADSSPSAYTLPSATCDKCVKWLI